MCIALHEILRFSEGKRGTLTAICSKTFNRSGNLVGLTPTYSIGFSQIRPPEKFTTFGSDYNGKVTALLGQKLDG